MKNINVKKQAKLVGGMDLKNLKPATGSVKSSKRIGRGAGSG